MTHGCPNGDLTSINSVMGIVIHLLVHSFKALIKLYITQVVGCLKAYDYLNEPYGILNWDPLLLKLSMNRKRSNSLSWLMAFLPKWIQILIYSVLVSLSVLKIFQDYLKSQSLVAHWLPNSHLAVMQEYFVRSCDLKQWL